MAETCAERIWLPISGSGLLCCQVAEQLLALQPYVTCSEIAFGHGSARISRFIGGVLGMFARAIARKTGSKWTVV
jgi:hypothetical protein